MRLAALLNNRYSEIENRKRMLKQKTADEAYKKNAEFFQPMSNPALDELVDLLTGKKEKDEQPALQQAIQGIKSQQVASTQDVEDVVASLSNDEVVDIFKRVQSSALSNDKPTAQDLKIAASAADFIAKNTEAQAPTNLEKTSTQLLGQEDEQAVEQPISFEKLMRNRLFEKAASNYQFQIQMAKTGLHPYESVYYQSA